METLRLTIEYDGSTFQGWQKQSNAPTVQQCFEEILEKLHGKPTVIFGASRTDSGVHAKAQVAHFCSEKDMRQDQWIAFFNTQLPPDVRVIDIQKMPPDFHSQKNVRSKIYEYRILNRGYASALDRRVYFYPKKLDWAAIRKGMAYLCGTHDFESFKASNSSAKTSIRTLFRFELSQETEHIYRFEIEGNGFLKQMIRTMIGTLIQVGEGKRTPESIVEILAAKDRRAAGPTAPAEGLCLVKINYLS